VVDRKRVLLTGGGGRRDDKRAHEGTLKKRNWASKSRPLRGPKIVVAAPNATANLVQLTTESATLIGRGVDRDALAREQ